MCLFARGLSLTFNYPHQPFLKTLYVTSTQRSSLGYFIRHMLQPLMGAYARRADARIVQILIFQSTLGAPIINLVHIKTPTKASEGATGPQTVVK